MSVQRVVVTGGAGFLGSHLCERLHADGAEVVCLDNLITGHADNLSSLVGKPGFTLMHYDVTNFIHVPGRVDAVLHFASPAAPHDYFAHPIHTLKVGSLGTHKTCGLARSKGARYLLASTSEIYGDPQVSPQREDYWGHVNAVGPRGVYDEAKRFAEAMTMAYNHEHGVDVRIARIFNTYGPRLRLDGRVVSNFVWQALQGKPITVYGEGTQTRSFCYVDDEVEGLIRLLHSDHVGPMNIGNPDEFTILELAHLVLELTGSDSEIVHEPLPVDDPKQRKPDISLAERVLGWRPEIGLREGLERTITWYREHMVV